MVKDMKKLLFVLLCISLCFGCSKMELEVSSENILGVWADDYSAYPSYAPEGGEMYTFKDDGHVDIHYYDVFAGDHDVTTTYTVGDSDNVIFINYPNVDESFKSYKIVKLTNDEMEWQRVGTNFSKRTVGSDFKHFVRSK